MVKALTVCQPYAEFIAKGAKQIENRTWPTSYRGLLLIHAGKSRAWFDGPTSQPWVFGAVVAVARIAECLRLDHAWRDREALRSNPHALGPWCWFLEDVRRVPNPVSARGAQGLWMPTREILDAVGLQIGLRL